MKSECTVRRGFAPLLLAAAAAAAAQAPAPDAAQASSRPTDLAELARRVDGAHRPSGPTPEVQSFACDIELRLVDPRAEQAGQVDLAVQFLLWRAEGSAKVRPLIRYEIRGAEQPIERGRDRFGPWQLVGGAPRDLTGAEFAQDLEQCARHTNLARQLLRFLAPGDVLRALAEPTMREEQLTLRRGLTVPCVAVTGDLDRYPLLQQAGEDAPVRLTIYVDRASHRLVAADARPRAGADVDDRRAERVVLWDLDERNGLLVPRRLDYLFRDESGEFGLHSRAMLTKVDLSPGLTVDDFDRSRR